MSAHTDSNPSLHAFPLSPKSTNHDLPILAEIGSSSRKRKLSDAKADLPDAKKGKTTTSSTSLPSPEFPNGAFYCHQCSKKRDMTVKLHCTKKSCRTKYCKTCVKNRYGQDADSIKSKGMYLIPETAHVLHVLDCGYIWNCPKCSDTCNCSRCRKAKGLDPTGNLTHAAKKTGNSAAGHLEANPTAIGILPGKGQQVRKSEKALAISKENVASGSKHAPQDAKIKPPRKQVVVPAPTWEKVPTALKRVQVEDRFMLREFVLRFSPLMDVSAKHLEDLDDFESMTDACAKALLMNLLGLIAADVGSNTEKKIKSTLKHLSSSGFHPNALWSIVADLRAHIPSHIVRIADPARGVTTTLRTRGVNYVSQAVQLVPVLVGFIETAIRGPSVREEIDNGMRDVKEANKKHFERLKAENDRWTEEKAALLEEKSEAGRKATWDAKGWNAKYKSRHNGHKAIVDKEVNEHARTFQSLTPRFRPLGRDHQGRVYYVSTAYTPKKLPTTEDRASLRRWSWFLAVWGLGGIAQDNAAEDSEDAGEAWWGFSDPKEIKKLAKWLAVNSDTHMESDSSSFDPVDNRRQRAGGYASPPVTEESSNVAMLNTEGPATAREVKSLVKGLSEYAEFLSWRIGA